MTPKLIGDTGDQATLWAKGVLLEFLKRFPDLRQDVVVGGGIAVVEWIGTPPDTGPLNTSDVDLLLDLHVADHYPRLRKALLESDLYEVRKDKRDREVPYSLLRKGPTPQQSVQLDFQGPSELKGASAKRDDLQQIGDLPAKKLEGGVIALQNSESRLIRGILPEGSSIEGQAKVVKPHILIPLKAVAFASRGLRHVDPEFRRFKDAMDLYALLRAWPAGPEGLAKDIRPYRNRTIVVNALMCLKEHFLDMRGQGVDAVVEFLQGRRPVDQVRREVVELASAYIQVVGAR